MSRTDVEQWLAREVGELLEAGSVGLYEFVWLLNGSEFELSDEDKRSVAYAVARRIVNAGAAELFELSWPGGEVVAGPVELTDRIATADDWPVGVGERYLGFRG